MPVLINQADDAMNVVHSDKVAQFSVPHAALGTNEAVDRLSVCLFIHGALAYQGTNGPYANAFPLRHAWCSANTASIARIGSVSDRTCW